MPNVGLCRRCTDKIEWRKKYRKYKPLTKPAVCNYCHQKEVKAAYHRACGPCGAEHEICPFCCKKWKDIDNDGDQPGEEGDEDEGDFQDSDEEGNKVEQSTVPQVKAAESDTSETLLCLEVQEPFASAIIQGKKTIETRTYPLPEKLLNQPISIVTTVYPESTEARKLPNFVPAGSVGGPRSNWEGWTFGDSKVFPSMKITHCVIFKECFAYPDEAGFLRDESKHLVSADSPFNVAATTPVYAWVVHAIQDSPFANMPLPRLVRDHRSIFRASLAKRPAVVNPSGAAAQEVALPPPPQAQAQTEQKGREQNFHGRAPVVNIPTKK